MKGNILVAQINSDRILSDDFITLQTIVWSVAAPSGDSHALMLCSCYLGEIQGRLWEVQRKTHWGQECAGGFANEPLTANVQAAERTRIQEELWGHQVPVPHLPGHDPPCTCPKGSALSHGHRLQDSAPSVHSFAHWHEAGVGQEGIRFTEWCKLSVCMLTREHMCASVCVVELMQVFCQILWLDGLC